MILSELIKLLVPNRCVLCHSDSSRAYALCCACHTHLPWLAEPVCGRCALPTRRSGLCGKCIARPPAFDRSLASFHYAAPINRFIHALKFYDQLLYAEILAHLLYEYASNMGATVDALVPVPLDKQRLRHRGFNQSQLIAKRLGMLLNIPVIHQSLIKHKTTLAQNQLSARARKSNVNGSYRLVTPIPHPRVALIDDVMTTGATAAACSRTLKKNGIEHVELWCCARSISPYSS